MGFLQRIIALIRGNLESLISSAEDPEKVLNVAIEDLRKQMIEAKGRVAIAIADEKRLAKQFETEVNRAGEWEKKAMTAVKAERDDLAVEALAKKKQHETAAMQFDRQLHEQTTAVEELKKALGTLSSKIDEAGRKRALLVARAKRAEAQKAIADTLSLANDRSAFQSFERMTEKVDRMEAEAEARLELAAAIGGTHDDNLAEKIRLLETSPVSDELADLKRKMGVLSAGAARSRALPPISTAANAAVQAEISGRPSLGAGAEVAADPERDSEGSNPVEPG